MLSVLQKKKRHKGIQSEEECCFRLCDWKCTQDEVVYEQSYGWSEDKLWKGWEKTIPVRGNSLEVRARLACPYEEGMQLWLQQGKWGRVEEKEAKAKSCRTL